MIYFIHHGVAVGEEDGGGGVFVDGCGVFVSDGVNVMRGVFVGAGVLLGIGVIVGVSVGGSTGVAVYSASDG